MFKTFFLLFVCLSAQAFPRLLTDGHEPSPALVEVLETLKLSPDESLDTISTQLQEKCQQTGDRWTFEHRFDKERESLMPLLEKLGCFDTVHASEKHYTYAVILGALRSTVQKRIDFLIEEWKRGIRFDQVVLLTGERELRPSENCLGLSSETEMMVMVWHDTTKPDELENLPLVIVHSPPAPGRDRATTESTVFAWLKLNPVPGSCLTISSQPYVGYQQAILQARLPQTFSVEAIGPEGGRDLPTAVLMDTLAKWLDWSKDT